MSAAVQWRLYQAHPWLAASLNLSRPLLVPHGMRHIDWALAALAALAAPAAPDGVGLDADTRMHAAVAHFGYVRGQAVDTEPEARATRTSGITAEQWMDAQHDRARPHDHPAGSGRLPHFSTASW
ncbi:hypothetical protein [Streptomyces sp. AC495_CC817]|uniref:hypothetical protein n=1 Tax=Streptomyces sp. AC495_CC817 TaxID=2823900 RepID=UPI0035A81E77